MGVSHNPDQEYDPLNSSFFTVSRVSTGIKITMIMNNELFIDIAAVKLNIIKNAGKDHSYILIDKNKWNVNQLHIW